MAVKTNDSGDRVTKLPSQRAQATRAKLVVGARKIFEANGFSSARVTDIADAAGVAHGSFYTYFESKEDAFRAVIDEVLDDTSAATHGWGGEHEDPIREMEESNRRYFEAYKRNRRMLIILDEVAGINPAFNVRVRQIRDDFVLRYSSVLKHLQSRGEMSPDIDPYHAACALGSMIYDSLRWWLGRDEKHDEGLALDTLNQLWAHGLGLTNAAKASSAS